MEKSKRTLVVAIFLLLPIALSSCYVSPLFGLQPDLGIVSHGSVVYPLVIQPQTLRGCNKIGFEYVNPAIEIRREVDPAYYDYDAQQIASWNANFVRLPFNSYWYLNDAAYRGYLRQQVDAFASEGLYVDMDLHSYGSPPAQGPYGGWTEQQSYDLFNNEMLPTLERVVTDYLDQPKVIAVELNEFWPMDDRADQNWILDLKVGNALAQKVHAINPTLLVFIDIYSTWVSDATISNTVGLITEPNIVFAPHFYCAQTPDGLILHPTGPAKYGADEGWDFYYAYEAGNLTAGKSKLYHWLDLYLKAVQNLYKVPFVVDEFATSPEPNLIQALKDIMNYFEAQNWGFSYFTYYGENKQSIQLLNGDWKTLMPQGETLVAELGGSSP
jgi:hypothetical protein